ncbi:MULTISPECIES: radical SAM family heme chaperone HemW [Psychrobacillus]|uniref:Heme chaperone HemW n=1 Tax=Psychrobacillus faecigallinarum TaxID=2762235 RepID=A0ABR8R7Q1_9BACI|nr:MULTISPECIES: radical SAM family heme chaperone HemW [Psychrobacillus]MBD7943823.1 oxygen-independent coproporphyrinogen III oxidase [Psychrobacillus faecigallinarum]QEY19335.1 oxygen-independent coproporphyrinogen III oxidase [Psychrobacillus sp. AK 1817]
MVRGVYIHIPFCHQICNYCDFNKFYFHNQPVDEYIESLGKEMALWQDDLAKAKIETIFLGGGTPTALSLEQLERLLTLIHQYIPLEHVKEFSSEANPDELTLEKMQLMRKFGVNRLSMGVQTFNQDLLKILGRTHSNNHVYDVIQYAKQTEFPSISIDLMYGLPNQTMEQWKESLQEAFRLKIPHISAYSLLVEPKTIFYNLLSKGKLSLPGEDLEAEMYGYLMDEMKRNGYKQYEISNFSYEGKASEHNLLYWNNDEYIGLGAGAHGYVNSIRYSNHGPLKKYMQQLEIGEKPVMMQKEVTYEEKMEEEMFLGLRKNQGVSLSNFEKRYGKSLYEAYGNEIEELLKKELIEIKNDYVFLTNRGRFVGNEVFQYFLK